MSSYMNSECGSGGSCDVMRGEHMQPSQSQQPSAPPSSTERVATGGGGVAAATLPTPEMSPMDPEKDSFTFPNGNDEHGGGAAVDTHRLVVIGGNGGPPHNPVTQLMSQFSGQSRYLSPGSMTYQQRLSCSLPTLRALVSQRPLNRYMYVGAPRDCAYGATASMMQQQPQQRQHSSSTFFPPVEHPSSSVTANTINNNNNNNNEDNDDDGQPSIPPPSYQASYSSPYSQMMMMTTSSSGRMVHGTNIPYQQHQQQQNQLHQQRLLNYGGGDSTASAIEQFSEAEMLDDVDRDEFDQYLKGTENHMLQGLQVVINGDDAQYHQQHQRLHHLHQHHHRLLHQPDQQQQQQMMCLESSDSATSNFGDGYGCNSVRGPITYHRDEYDSPPSSASPSTTTSKATYAPEAPTSPYRMEDANGGVVETSSSLISELANVRKMYMYLDQ